MARNGSNLDYFYETLACIQHVHELTTRATGDRRELHPQQCRYLSSKVSETGGFLRAKTESLRDISGVDDIGRKALRHLHFTVKRAETLVRSCFCEFETSWLEAAVTLTNIKEEIVDILLDLQWWTSVVGIAIAAVLSMASGQNNELELVTAAEEDFEKLMAQLLPGGQFSNELDNAVAIDKEELLLRVLEVQSRYANIAHDHEYLLATYVHSRLDDIDVTQSMTDVELNTYETDGRILGWGANGVVMLVRWLGRNCAMKQLKEICPKEATTLSPFQHPHIVQFFRYWEAADHSPPGGSATPPVTTDATLSPKIASNASVAQQADILSTSHILMELLPLDLAKHMAKVAKAIGMVSVERSATGAPPDARSPLSQDVAIDVMLQLAKALWHLNSKDVAHRDLKPNNCLVRPVSSEDAPELAVRGYVRMKLGDFGLAKTVSSSAYSLQSGNVGHKLYGAPEVFNYEAFSGKRFPLKADVWSYGMIFSQLLSGREPFEGYTRGTLNNKIKNGARPKLPKDCPDYLQFIIEHCWKYKQEDRPTFMDLWKMVRFAQVRSLGIIRENHQLFTFTTREGVVKRLQKLPWSGDYFKEALACIQHVREYTTGAIGDRKQLHHHQCRYLLSKVSETGGFLRAKTDSLRDISGVDDIRRKALRQLHFTVKRAEMLVRSCFCEFETWLEAAVTLPNIKEDVVDILLDLQWWTSMVGIAIASDTSVGSGQNNELELVTAAEEEFEMLMGQLLPGGQCSNDLDNAVAIDKEELLKRLREVQSQYANKAHDHEYLLATHVRSRLEDIDVTHSMADSELNAYETRELLGFGGFGAVLMVKWLGRDCALKKLRYSCTKEATTLSSFQHPHIVQFFRYWEAPFSVTRSSSSATPPLTSDEEFSSTSFATEETNLSSKSHILMELLPLDLAQHMTSAQSKSKVSLKMSATGALPDVQAALSQDMAIDVMLQLAKAMWHLNSKNVAHRDLKPSNVLVRPVSREDVPELAERGYLRVKLGDFGLAKTRAQSTASSMQTCNVGSRIYSAPEVFNKDSISRNRFPRKADVWSYGLIFSEILSGEQPFKGVPFSKLNNEIMKGMRPVLPRTCPNYLTFIIEQCWKYKQADRPNFMDLWKMVRFAQVRSLGLIREDHHLFSFTTREGVLQWLHKRRPHFIIGPSMPRLDDKPLSYMVNEVGAPDAGATSTLDVIFFEGNVGRRKFLSCKDTWVQRGKPNVWWPRDWLVKDFKGEIRVLVLQYDISDHGVENVVDDLQRYLVFSERWNRWDQWNRPIVLVGHSLGCVVIEHLVVALNQKARSIDRVKNEFHSYRATVARAFLDNLAGCFFYAPPYTGLVPHEDLLKHVFGGLTYSPELFKDLCLDSSKLHKLSEQFMLARSKRVLLMALIEDSQTQGRTVVPPESMQEFMGEVEELGDSDHGNTCKPINKDHPAYRRLVEFVRAIQNENGCPEYISRREAKCWDCSLRR